MPLERGLTISDRHSSPLLDLGTQSPSIYSTNQSTPWINGHRHREKTTWKATRAGLKQQLFWLYLSWPALGLSLSFFLAMIVWPGSSSPASSARPHLPFPFPVMKLLLREGRSLRSPQSFRVKNPVMLLLLQAGMILQLLQHLPLPLRLQHLPRLLPHQQHRRHQQLLPRPPLQPLQPLQLPQLLLPLLLVVATVLLAPRLVPHSAAHLLRAPPT